MRAHVGAHADQPQDDKSDIFHQWSRFTSGIETLIAI